MKQPLAHCIVNTQCGDNVVVTKSINVNVICLCVHTVDDWLCSLYCLQTDEGRKIIRNYNKMASVLLEYEVEYSDVKKSVELKTYS